MAQEIYEYGEMSGYTGNIALKQQLEALRAQLGNALGGLQEMQHVLQEKKTQHAQGEEEIASLQNNLSAGAHMQKILQENHTHKVKNTHAERDVVQNEMRVLTQQKGKLEKQIASLHRVSEQDAEQAELLQGEIVSLGRENAALQELVQTSQEEGVVLQRQEAAFQQENQALTEKHAQLRAETIQINERLLALHKEQAVNEGATKKKEGLERSSQREEKEEESLPLVKESDNAAGQSIQCLAFLQQGCNLSASDPIKSQEAFRHAAICYERSIMLIHQACMHNSLSLDMKAICLIPKLFLNLIAKGAALFVTDSCMKKLNALLYHVKKIKGEILPPVKQNMLAVYQQKLLLLFTSALDAIQKEHFVEHMRTLYALYNHIHLFQYFCAEQDIDFQKEDFFPEFISRVSNICCENKTTQVCLKQALEQMLEKRGIPTKKGTKEIPTYLYLAVLHNLVEPIRWILTLGKQGEEKIDLRHQLAVLDTYPELGKMPLLHIAAMRGNKEAMEALLKAGADIHSTTRDGKTAFYCAVLAQQKESVAFLLAKGAPAEQASIDLARKRNLVSVLALLEDAEEKIEGKLPASAAKSLSKIGLSYTWHTGNEDGKQAGKELSLF